MRSILNNSKLHIGLLLGLSCVLIYGLLTDGHAWRQDFAAYVMQAESILEHNISGLIADNIASLKESIHPQLPVAHPWGVPLLLAPFYKAFGLDIQWLKMVGVICYLLFLVLLYRGFAHYHSRFGVLGVTAVFAVNPAMLSALNEVLSDIPFLLFSVLGVLLIGRVIVKRRPLISLPIDYILIGMVLSITFLIRNNGVLLIILTALTQFIAFISDKRRGETPSTSPPAATEAGPNKAPSSLLIGLLPYLTFLCLLGLQALLHPQVPLGGISHFNVLEKSLDGTIPNSILINAVYYAGLPILFFGSFILYAISVPFTLMGLTKRWKTDYHVVIYAVLTILLHIIWPGKQGLRYLFPLLPFYVSYMFTGIEASYKSARIFGKPTDPNYLIAGVVAALLIFLEDTGYHVYRNMANGSLSKGPFAPETPEEGPYTPQAQEMFRFIKSNTGDDDLIVFFRPWIMRLMADRMSAGCSYCRHLGDGDYVVIYKYKKRLRTLYDDALKEVPDRETLFENSRFIVIRI